MKFIEQIDFRSEEVQDVMGKFHHGFYDVGIW